MDLSEEQRFLNNRVSKERFKVRTVDLEEVVVTRDWPFVDAAEEWSGEEYLLCRIGEGERRGVGREKGEKEIVEEQGKRARRQKVKKGNKEDVCTRVPEKFGTKKGKPVHWGWQEALMAVVAVDREGVYEEKYL